MEYQSKTTRSLIAKNIILIVTLGSIVIFMIINVYYFLKYPTPPPLIIYDQLTLAAGVILVISLPIIWFLKRMGF